MTTQSSPNVRSLIKLILVNCLTLLLLITSLQLLAIPVPVAQAKAGRSTKITPPPFLSPTLMLPPSPSTAPQSDLQQSIEAVQTAITHVSAMQQTQNRVTAASLAEPNMAGAATELALTITSNNALRPELTPDYITHIAQNEIMHGDRTRANIALTFDCEGNFEAIKKMVDILDANQAKGTFFLMGSTVANSPEIVPLILAGGHELGNHSYHHSRFSTLTYTEVLTELLWTEHVISKAAGTPVPMRYFRFPYGDRNQQHRDWIAELGYQSIFWDVDPQGWRASMTATQVISTVVNEAKPGSIVLMHCGRAADEAALPTIITDLQMQGYKLETLSQVLPPDPMNFEAERL